MKHYSGLSLVFKFLKSPRILKLMVQTRKSSGILKAFLKVVEKLQAF